MTFTTPVTLSAPEDADSGARPPGPPVAHLEDLRISVGHSDTRPVVVDGLTLDIRPGETVGLVGESGSGKTMTALALAGLLPRGARVESGLITVAGTEVTALPERARRRFLSTHLGVVFQNPTAALNPRLTIATQVREALPPGARRDRRLRAAELLEQVGIDEVGKTLGAFPHELSGGLNQRVVIALALARSPKLLVADEPTTALDVSVQARVLDLLDDLTQRLGLSVLLVSHDIGVIADRTDHVYVMAAGRIVESGPTPVVLHTPAHADTQRLLASTPALLQRLPTADVEHTEPPTLVRVRDVHRSFPIAVPGRLRRTRHIALDGVSLDVPAGAAIGIVGESGSGKTTLARQIVGLDRPDTGTVDYDDTPLDRLDTAHRREWRRAVQYVFQDPYGALDPRLTVARSIAEPLELNGVDLTGTTVAQRVRELLAEVELPTAFADRRPGELSGGQLQRVVIARALANDPRLLVADEPVSALDLSVQARILRLLERLRRDRGLTLLLISHDLAVVRYLCDRIVVMEHGRIVETGATHQIYTAPRHPYTAALLASVPGRRLHTESRIRP